MANWKRSSKLLLQPKQYTQGWVEFYKLRFKVTPDVLIPRPETELLVDEVLAHARPGLGRLKPLTILDIGTGSGNIAISLAKNLPASRQGLASHLTSGNVDIIATDISKKALKVAQQNAKLHGVENQITLIQSDLLLSLNGQNLRSLKMSPPDIVVTNLPYIPTQRIPYLDSSVKDFEPHLALDGGKDGFELYRKLFQQISLTPQGWEPKLLIGEIDYTHGELAVRETQKFFPQAEVEVKTDLTHKQRILIITFKPLLFHRVY